MTFKEEILNRINQLKSEKKINLKKKQFSKLYIGSISEYEGLEVTALDEFQIAFIDLFTEKNKQLGEQFEKILEGELKEILEPSDLDKIDLDEDIGFYNLNVPKQNGNDEWSVELATSFDETIFHAYFTGWSFTHLGLTH